MISFALQNTLSLIRPHLFIFCFYFCYSGRWVKKDYHNLCQSVMPIFSSESFILSGLTFRASLIALLEKNPPVMQERLVQFLGWEDLLEKG